MASGALPPGFPPIEIDGELYWDGGIVSNTPLQYVLDEAGPREDMVSSRSTCSRAGRDAGDARRGGQREKDIRYSSRTRLNTTFFASCRRRCRRQAPLARETAAELRDDPDWRLLAGLRGSRSRRRPPHLTGSKHY